LKQHYLIKIVPPWGYRVFRLRFTARQIALVAALAVVALGGVGGFYGVQMRHAQASVGELRSLTDDQRTKLQQIDAKASELDSQLRALEHQDEQIRRMFGADGKAAKAGAARPAAGAPDAPLKDDRQSGLGAPGLGSVAERLQRLHDRSARLLAEGGRLQNLALHVLNMRRLEDLARASVLAAIPSINPAGSSGIASNFGWRVDPWPEFHEGVDLDANYGDPVRAAAAGTVVSAGYDGGFGLKVDLDHGNGYHTWYCHLSRIDVTAGQYVTKAGHIALVGSTGASTGPHLHYQIMLDGHPVDPAPYLNGIPAKVLAQLK
jgi:murein DD-endopeptidase MepM/ murein hydrolase activator NlpD